MNENGLLTVVVPVFNEEGALPDVLNELTRHCSDRGYKLIVINDGSFDRSAEMIKTVINENNLARCITHKVNKGYGAAIKSAVKEVETKYMITFDSDGQHLPGEIDKLLNEALKSDADLVVGIRGKNSSGRYRHFGKQVIRAVASLLVKLKVADLNSGMKLYVTESAKRLMPLCPDNIAFSDVVTILFVGMKLRVCQVPINVQVRSTGKSTVSALTVMEIIHEIMNIIMFLNPLRIFIPLSLIFTLSGIIWGLPIVIAGRGVSVGAMLAIVTGLLFLFMGLLASQISLLRKREL